MESLAVRVADVPIASISGMWQRHAAAAYKDRALDGRVGYGRWGTRGGFPVLYLGRPMTSVVVEAYRHLVDPVEDPGLLAQLQPRVLVTCELELTDVVDLRSAGARLQVGLTVQDLQSAVEDRDAYARCQEIAQVAHQLGRHGLIVPAATQLGDTLAVFTDITPARELPRRSAPDIYWDRLPADPRSAADQSPVLKIVRNDP